MINTEYNTYEVLMYSVIPLFQPAFITTTASVFYTSPVAVGQSNGVNTRISNITVTNTDVAPRTISLYITPGTSTPTTVNTIINSKTLAINETFVIYQCVGNVLSPGSSIQAIADVAGKVVFAASGIQFS